MQFQFNFKRYEIKYLITINQYNRLIETIKEKMIADEFGKSTICNIYFDTPNFRLIRKSIEKSVYKEKLRLRSYGIPSNDSVVFLELKKKYDNVVYKRREKMKYDSALEFLNEQKPYSQVTKEISYFMEHYGNLIPTCFLSYSREAYFGKDNRNLRITFDTDILWRDYDLDFKAGIFGKSILQDKMILMEVKLDNAMPLWLTEVLTKEKKYKTSFSKYGQAYEKMKKKDKLGEINHA